MIKHLLSCIGQYKRDTILSPIYVTLEVVMEILIPLYMADLIDQGMIWGTMTQDFYKMGYESVKMIETVKAGGTVESVQDSGTQLVTKDNLEEYKARF